MAFQLTQVIECSQVPESFHEPDKKVQIGTLKIGDKDHKIFQGITKIGRLPSCEIYLQDITVSKIHSEIEASRKNVFICDLNSSNKTHLNDVVLRPNRFYEVKDGARLKFGIIEGKFSLLESSDKSFTAPETPDSSLNLRHQSISDHDSFIQNTPAIEAGKFRRPHFPIQKTVSKQIVVNDISQVETQVQLRDNVQELETQCSIMEMSKETHCGSKSHIQELETQVGVVNDIEDAETQFSIEENETQGLDHRPTTSMLDIQNIDTQVIDSRKNVQGISEERRRIQELETQFDEHQGDIQDMQTQILEFGNNKECVMNKKDTLRDKIDGRRQLERQKRIEELNTQIFEANAFGTAEKMNEEEIYDLPTQSNWDYLENLKKQELLKDSQSPSSSPDLLGTYNQVIIAESDDETVEDAAPERVDIEAIVKNNVLSNVIDTGDDNITENDFDEIENCDESRLIEDNHNYFERTKSLKTKAERTDKFKRNGIISESDSGEDDNNMRNEEKVSFCNSKDRGKSSQSIRPSPIIDSEKSKIKEATNEEKVKSNSQLGDENDFDGNDEEKENQPTSSLKNNSKNSSDARDCESVPEDSITGININLDNHSDSETDYEDSMAVERKSSFNLLKNNLEKSKFRDADENERTISIPTKIRKLLDAPKRTAEDNFDSDDSCSAPTQLIIPPKPHEVQKRLRSSTQEEPLPTQIIPVSPGSLQDDHSEGNNTTTYEDLEPTQKIEFGKRKSPVDERKSDCRGFESCHVLRYHLNDDESDEDMAPTQKIELPRRFQSRRLSLKSPLTNADYFKVSERSRREAIDELPPTQILDDNETQTQLITNDPSIKVHTARLPDDDDGTQTQLINDETSTKAHTAQILDDDAQTQLINCDPSTKIQSTTPSPAETPIKSPTTRSTTRTKNSIDKIPVRRLDGGDSSVKLITSTPVSSPSPIKRRKFSLSLKQSKKESEISETNQPFVKNLQRSIDNSDHLIKKKLDINSKSLLINNEISGPSHSVSSSSIREKFMNRKRNSKGKALKKKFGEKSSAHISDSSDDEDMDYAKVNAMADRFIASSEVAEVADQSSNRVTREISTTEALNNSKLKKNHRIDNETPLEDVYLYLKEVPYKVEKKSPQARRTIPEKGAEVIKKPRGRGKIPKLMKIEKTLAPEDKQEIKNKPLKKRKLQSNESSNSSLEYEKRGKKMKDSHSDESTVGAESQEVQRILEGNESLQESPLRSIRTKARSFESEKMTFCVLFTGIEDDDGIRANGVVALGGSLTNDPHKATILVTDKIRRTIKFFCAVSRSILIASVDWLDDSIKSGRFQDPKKYLLHDAAAESKFRFSLSKSLQRAKTKKLLEGYTVLLTPKIVGPSIANLKTMVQVSGGKPLVRAPKAWTKTTIIISCDEDLPYVRRILSKTKSQVPVVSIEFLLSGILRQQLEYEEFSLALSS